MKLRDLLTNAGELCQIGYVEIVPIDESREDTITVYWDKDWDGEGPKYEYDDWTERYCPFYFEDFSEDKDNLRITCKKPNSEFQDVTLDLASEDWRIDTNSLNRIKEDMKRFRVALKAISGFSTPWMNTKEEAANLCNDGYDIEEDEN